MKTTTSRWWIETLTMGLISLALLALPASAARWTTLGPTDDGTVLSLAFAPSRPAFVYAGTLGGGVSRSIDGGRTWASANAGLTDSVIGALAIFPGDHRVVWAAAESGLYRSLDAGHTWIRVFTDRVDTVAVDPDNALIVYLGTRDRMFRSGNGGATWLPMGETLVPFETRFWVNALVVAQSRPQTLYASYQGTRSGLFASENGGIGWARIAWGEFSLLAADPRVPETLWAADAHGVLLTRDAGATWTRVLQRGKVSALTISADGGRVFAAVPGAVLMTRDHGTHWRRVGVGLPARKIHGLAVDPANPARLLAGPEERGAFGVDEPAGRWQRTSAGLAGFAASAVEPAPDGSSLWVASRLGLYRTTDGGTSWARVLRGASLRFVAPAPGDPRTIYTGGEDSPLGGGPALYCSQDGGRSWKSAARGITGAPVLRLVVHPQDPLTAYVGTWTGAYKTTDAGETWTALPLTGIVNDLAIAAMDPDRLYATAMERLYHSHDGGTTWHVLMDGGLGAHLGVLRGIAVAATDPQSLAVIDNERIFLSRDGGRTWQVLKGPGFVTGFRTVAFNPGNAEILLVGGNGGAAFSTDGGTTWRTLGAGISGLNVNQIPTIPGVSMRRPGPGV